MAIPKDNAKLLLPGTALPPGAVPTNNIIAGIIRLAEVMAEIRFYPYQREIAWFIVESVLLHKGEEFTALCSRQSGKSTVIAAVCGALEIILPYLAKMYPDDWRFNCTDEQGRYRGFAKGISIGIYGPTGKQSEVTIGKVLGQFSSDTTKQILAELAIDAAPTASSVRLSNGSKIKAISASVNSHIEGETHHLVLLDESQDIDDRVIEKSISPMLSTTFGTCVKIGTANDRKSNFYASIRRNIRRDAVHGMRTHFSYPWQVCVKHNSRYRDYVEKEKRVLGEHSDSFQMSYNCCFVLERGMFITDTVLFDGAVALAYGSFSRRYTGKGDCPPRPFDMVAGIDFAKKKDETVVTMMAINWSKPLAEYVSQDSTGNDIYCALYERHIVDWMVMAGENYDTQFMAIYAYLQKWPRLRRVVVDSTGLGQVMYDRFCVAFDESVEVLGIDFTAQSNSEMYKYLASELATHRLTYPNDEDTRKTVEHAKFIAQMLDLEKTYTKSGILRVAAPENEKDAHDDFGDSLALAVYGSKEPPDNLYALTEETHMNLLHG